MSANYPDIILISEKWNSTSTLIKLTINLIKLRRMSLNSFMELDLLICNGSKTSLGATFENDIIDVP